MIPDGFNRCEIVNGHWMIYRRMLHGEREILSNYDKAEPGIDKVVLTHIASKIVAVETGQSPIDFITASNDHNTIFDAIVGHDKVAEEAKDEFRLIKGAVLRIRYPHLLTNPCEECQKHVYFPLTNSYQEDGARGRIPFEQGVDTLLCHTHRGCPRVKPGMEDGDFWNSRCEMAFLHDQQCRNFGHWPQDATVMRNKRLLDIAYREVEKHENQ